MTALASESQADVLGMISKPVQLMDDRLMGQLEVAVEVAGGVEQCLLILESCRQSSDAKCKEKIGNVQVTVTSEELRDAGIMEIEEGSLKAANFSAPYWALWH
ncbi:unnamed protein product [Caretta caretta]